MNVDTSSNVLDAGEGGIVEGTCPIDGSADSFNFVETVDGLKLGIVGDEECSVDGLEDGEGQVC